MTHSTNAANNTTMPRMNTIGVVMVPRRRTTAPSTDTSGHILAEGADTAACEPTVDSVSPSRVESERPASNPVAAIIPNNAVPPIEDGPTKMRYTANATPAKALSPMKYLDPVVNIVAYFCTYTTNHMARNVVARKYQYSACALTT